MSKKNDYNEMRVQMAKKHRDDMMKQNHKSAMMIRKLDQSANRIKDYNQKNPKDLQLVPKASLHKVTI